MRAVDPGHIFALDALDGDLDQRLIFVKREGPRYPGNVGSHPGTTMQEVLRALISRARYVDGQVPCGETQAVIRMLQTSILLLEVRAKRVKGKTLDIPLQFIEAVPTCKTCGHVLCEEQHG